MKGSNRRSELELGRPPSRSSIPSRSGSGSRRRSPRSSRRSPTAPGMPVSPAAGEQARRQVRHRARLRRAVAASSSASPRTASCWRSPRTTSTRARRKFDRLVFRIIPDDNVRLANLRSGDIDLMHLVAPTDAANLKKEGTLRGLERDGHRLQRASPSTCATRRARPSRPGNLGTPLANDPRVREALDLVHRPRGAEPGGVGRPVHAGLHAHLAGEPLLRQEPQVPDAGRGQGQEAPGRRGPRRAATASR